MPRPDPRSAPVAADPGPAGRSLLPVTGHPIRRCRWPLDIVTRYPRLLRPVPVPVARLPNRRRRRRWRRGLGARRRRGIRCDEAPYRRRCWRAGSSRSGRGLRRRRWRRRDVCGGHRCRRRCRRRGLITGGKRCGAQQDGAYSGQPAEMLNTIPHDVALRGTTPIAGSSARTRSHEDHFHDRAIAERGRGI